MSPAGTTRRELLRNGGLAAAAFGAAATGLRHVPAAAADDVAGVSAARAATYVGAVEAVALAPENQVDASRADDALREFGQWYGDAGDDTRQGVDHVLDALAVTPAGGTTFASLDAADRLALLRSASTDAPSANAAVTLAAFAFYPHGVDDHSPVVSV